MFADGLSAEDAELEPIGADHDPATAVRTAVETAGPAVVAAAEVRASVIRIRLNEVAASIEPAVIAMVMMTAAVKPTVVVMAIMMSPTIVIMSIASLGFVRSAGKT